MSTRTLDRKTGVTTTVGVAGGVPATFTTASGTAGTFRARINGRDTTSGDVVAGAIQGAYRNIAGTLTVVGALSAGLAVADAALAAAVVTVAANGTALEVQVTGVLAKTIEWFADLELLVN